MLPSSIGPCVFGLFDGCCCCSSVATPSLPTKGGFGSFCGCISSRTPALPPDRISGSFVVGATRGKEPYVPLHMSSQLLSALPKALASACVSSSPLAFYLLVSLFRHM